MIDTSSLDKVGEYIEQLEQGGKQARKRVVELVDEKNKLEEENKNLREEMKNRDKYRIEENKRLRKGIDLRLDSMGVKYIMTEEGDYFAKSDFKITE